MTWTMACWSPQAAQCTRVKATSFLSTSRAPLMNPRTRWLSRFDPPSLASTCCKIRSLSANTVASALEISTRYSNLSIIRPSISKAIMSGSADCLRLPPRITTTTSVASTAAWISTKHQTLKKAICFRVDSFKTLISPEQTNHQGTWCTSGREEHTRTNEGHKPIVARKSKSAEFPGHCRTANTSIQTRRCGSAPSAKADTRSPHSAPQQWLAKVCACPVTLAISANSEYRQRVISVAGLMR
eukprot:Lithocolla_globosa_v1_NODE_2781_length_1870_cov_5.496419.p2 type:complete len:242 gc:universal NODE_2781_length_1870_cov_5.496419:1424-699(-)